MARKDFLEELAGVGGINTAVVFWRSTGDHPAAVVDTREQEPYAFDCQCVAVTRQAANHFVNGRVELLATGE